MSVTTLLPKAVTIQRGTRQIVPGQEMTLTWAAVATNVSADVQSGRGGRRLTDSGQYVDGLWLGVFPVGTDVLEGDRIVDGARTYDVKFADTVRGHHMEADLTRVDVV